MEVAADLQQKNAYTVKELANLFKMSRQAMDKHVKQLDKSMVARNNKGYTIILWQGVEIIAENLGCICLLE